VSDPLPLETVDKTLHALEQEGRHLEVVSHTWYWFVAQGAPGKDVLVLQDDTYRRYMESKIFLHHCDARWCEEYAVTFDGVHFLCEEHREQNDQE
jgi:hypothetical protein